MGTTDLAAGDGREGAVTGGAVGKEGGALHLLDVVETGDADEALGKAWVHARISWRTSSGLLQLQDGELP